MRIFLFFLLALFPFLTTAQNTETASDNLFPPLPACQDVISFSGPTQVKINSAYDFGLLDNNGSVLPAGEIKIISDEKSETIPMSGNNLTYSFTQPGIVKIIFSPKNVSTYSCEGNIEKEIHIYREKISYIGTERTDIADPTMAGIFRQKSVLLEPIFLGNHTSTDDYSSLWNAIWNSDIIIFNHKNITEILPELEKFQKIKEYNFSNTQFFIISDYSRSFLGKILANSVAKLWIQKIFLISEDQFSTLLWKWSYEDNRNISLWEPLLYEKKSSIITMNHFLEYLAYSGVSYQFLWFLLVLSVVALVFNIFKQVIGFDTFSLYYPILLAIIIAQMGYVFSATFTIIALTAISIIKFVTERIQLLANAKKAFLISVYVLLSLAVLGLDNLFEIGIFNYNIFQNSITVIAIFTILFIMEKLFDGMKILSKSGILYFLRYVFIVAIAVGIFSWQWLKFLLISYPDIIFLVVIFNLLVGRYTGLQVVEYLRFSPILNNIHEEE